MHDVAWCSTQNLPSGEPPIYRAIDRRAIDPGSPPRGCESGCSGTLSELAILFHRLERRAVREHHAPSPKYGLMLNRFFVLSHDQSPGTLSVAKGL